MNQARRDTPHGRGPAVDAWQPTSRRRRLLIALLAVATASTVMWMVLEKPGAPPRPNVPARSPSPGPAQAAACAPGQTEGCIGGKTQVIVVPATASSSPAR